MASVLKAGADVGEGAGVLVVSNWPRKVLNFHTIFVGTIHSA